MTSSLTRPQPRQRPPTSARVRPANPTEFQRQFRANAEAALAEEFKGITAGGTIEPGLFALQETGVSTRPIQDAAEAFLASLDAEQQRTARFSLDDDAWRRWCNLHTFVMRHGVLLETLSAAQVERAFGLLRASFSERGFESARSVMKLNETIGEITGLPEEFGEWLYWLSIFGTPSADEPWGWQIDGHHLNVNCLLVKDQLVMTPMFMGSEPVYADVGKHAGTRVFEAEESGGLALMRALTPEQREQALLGPTVPREVFTTAFRDNFELRYEGLRFADLSSAQQRQALELVETYVGRMRPGHAAIKRDEVKRHLADTHFAWLGGYDDESVFYYRVHSPVILIEFDHLPGIALDNNYPSRHHIHTVVRTPNGNDYGKDLLRQHRERFDHSHPASAHS
jgi:hypothetical protein